MQKTESKIINKDNRIIKIINEKKRFIEIREILERRNKGYLSSKKRDKKKQKKTFKLMNFIFDFMMRQKFLLY